MSGPITFRVGRTAEYLSPINYSPIDFLKTIRPERMKRTEALQIGEWLNVFEAADRPTERFVLEHLADERSPDDGYPFSSWLYSYQLTFPTDALATEFRLTFHDVEIVEVTA